jgi:hypothetical protein
VVRHLTSTGRPASWRTLPFLCATLRWLSETHTWSAAILVYELDAGGFQSASECPFISRRHRDRSVHNLYPSNGGHPNLGRFG